MFEKGTKKANPIKGLADSNHDPVIFDLIIPLILGGGSRCGDLMRARELGTLRERLNKGRSWFKSLHINLSNRDLNDLQDQSSLSPPSGGDEYSPEAGYVWGVAIV